MNLLVLPNTGHSLLWCWRWSNNTKWSNCIKSNMSRESLKEEKTPRTQNTPTHTPLTVPTLKVYSWWDVPSNSKNNLRLSPCSEVQANLFWELSMKNVWMESCQLPRGLGELHLKPKSMQGQAALAFVSDGCTCSSRCPPLTNKLLLCVSDISKWALSAAAAHLEGGGGGLTFDFLLRSRFILKCAPDQYRAYVLAVCFQCAKWKWQNNVFESSGGLMCCFCSQRGN